MKTFKLYVVYGMSNNKRYLASYKTLKAAFVAVDADRFKIGTSPSYVITEHKRGVGQ